VGIGTGGEINTMMKMYCDSGRTWKETRDSKITNRNWLGKYDENMDKRQSTFYRRAVIAQSV
jgi:hypothetical protein